MMASVYQTNVLRGLRETIYNSGQLQDILVDHNQQDWSTVCLERTSKVQLQFNHVTLQSNLPDKGLSQNIHVGYPTKLFSFVGDGGMICSFLCWKWSNINYRLLQKSSKQKQYPHAVCRIQRIWNLSL